MYEIVVHSDGKTEVRKIPSSYKGDGSTVIKDSWDSAFKELGDYGHPDNHIQDALAAAENDWEWVTV